MKAPVHEDLVPDDWAIVEAEVTAYCPCSRCCGKWADGITASGTAIKDTEGAFVAAPKGIPYQTLVQVLGYAGGRPVKVLDRGGAIHARDGRLRLDVFFPSHRKALEWGRRIMKVKMKKRGSNA